MANLPWRRHRKRDIPGDLWTSCPACNETIFGKDLDANMKVCTKCGFHFPITSHERIVFTLDPASFEERDVGMATIDALTFVDNQPYPDKLEASAVKTGLREAMRYGVGRLAGRPIVLGVLEFRFMGGSMGVVVGEKVTRAVELAGEQGLPLVLFASSGGARMHEGILSLMQMAKTCSALGAFREEGGLFISVCTHPTTGGVTASWAMTADLILAEPGALIGFAGPRVIEGTIKKKLPDGFQRSEFLLEKGQIDMIVPRTELRDTIEKLLDYAGEPVAAADDAAPAGSPKAADEGSSQAPDAGSPSDRGGMNGGGSGGLASTDNGS